MIQSDNFLTKHTCSAQAHHTFISEETIIRRVVWCDDDDDGMAV